MNDFEKRGSFLLVERCVKGALGLLMVSASLVACGQDQPALTERNTVHDSFGIEVVENRSPRLSPGAWTVDEPATIEIGAAEGAPPEVLSGVSSAAALSGGRITILDGGSRQLRIFTSTGEFIRAVGGPGEGPGDFAAPWSLERLPADSIQVFDLGLGRLSVFDQDGNFERSIQLREGGGYFHVGTLSDGSHLAYRSANVVGEKPGRRRESSTVLRFSPDGSIADTVGLFPGLEVLVRDTGAGPRRIPFPFGHRRLNEVTGELLTIGFDERYELLQYAPDGELLRVIRRTADPLPVTSKEHERYLEEFPFLSGADLASAVDQDEAHPVFTSLIADELGNLWVEEFRPPDLLGPSLWSVFDGDGIWMTDVEVPAGVDVTYVGDQVVVGVFRDDLGVEYVRVYALDKAS